MQAERRCFAGQSAGVRGQEAGERQAGIHPCSSLTNPSTDRGALSYIMLQILYVNISSTNGTSSNTDGTASGRGGHARLQTSDADSAYARALGGGSNNVTQQRQQAAAQLQPAPLPNTFNLVGASF